MPVHDGRSPVIMLVLEELKSDDLQSAFRKVDPVLAIESMCVVFAGVTAKCALQSFWLSIAINKTFGRFGRSIATA